MNRPQIVQILEHFDKKCRALLAQIDVLCGLAGEGGSGSLVLAAEGVISGYSAAVADQIGTTPEFIEDWVYQSAIAGDDGFRFRQEWPDGTVTHHQISSAEDLADFLVMERAACARALH